MTTFTAPFTVQDVDANALLAIDSNNTLTSSIKGQYKVAKIATISAGNTTEDDTAFALPANAIIKDVFLNVKTAEVTGATKTVKVGLLSSQGGGNALGFLNGVSVASVGIAKGKAIVTTGVNTNYFSATTKGAFLADFFAGSDVAGHEGLYNEHAFLSGSVAAKNISFTRGSAFSECVADIYVEYLEL